MTNAPNVKSQLQKLMNDQSGNISILLGLLIVPIIIGVGVAVDTTHRNGVQAKIQDRLDSAVIRGVQFMAEDPDATNSQIESYVETKFFQLAAPLGQRYKLSSYELETEVENTNDDRSIEIKLETELDTTFLKLLTDTLEIKIRTKAVAIGEGMPDLCLLALDSTSTGITVSGTADLTATECTVYSNADLAQSGSSAIDAGFNCAGGTAAGNNILPEAQISCPVLTDPLFAQVEPYFVGIQSRKPYCDSNFPAQTPLVITTTVSALDVSGMHMGYNTIGSCRPVEIGNGGHLIVPNGSVMNVYGFVTIKSGGKLTINDGSLVMHGAHSSLQVQAQGSLDITAPATGYLAGIAIAMEPTIDGLSGVTADRTSMDHFYSEIVANGGEQIDLIGGGTIEMVGSLYASDRIVRITGSGDISMASDYFAVIARSVDLEGNGVLNIGPGADNVAYGMPSMPDPDSTSGLVNVALTR